MGTAFSSEAARCVVAALVRIGASGSAKTENAETATLGEQFGILAVISQSGGRRRRPAPGLAPGSPGAASSQQLSAPAVEGGKNPTRIPSTDRRDAHPARPAAPSVGRKGAPCPPQQRTRRTMPPKSWLPGHWPRPALAPWAAVETERAPPGGARGRAPGSRCWHAWPEQVDVA